MSLVALEAALAAAPDDPLVLAAYADCLSDAGDPRGDYLRLQQAIEGMEPRTPNRPALERALKALWRQHAGDWLPPGRWDGHVGHYVMFTRVPAARVHRLRGDTCAALRRSPAWWLLRAVEIDSYADDLDRPFESGEFFVGLVRSRVRELRVTARGFGDLGVAELVRSGLIARLESLHLVNCGVTDSGAEELAGCPDLRRVRDFDLDGNDLSPIGHDALAAVGVHVSDRQTFMPGGWDYDPPAFPDD